MGDYTQVLNRILYFCTSLLELVNGHEIKLNILLLSTPRVPRRTLPSGTSKHPKGT